MPSRMKPRPRPVNPKFYAAAKSLIKILKWNKKSKKKKCYKYHKKINYRIIKIHLIYNQRIQNLLIIQILNR